MFTLFTHYKKCVWRIIPPGKIPPGKIPPGMSFGYHKVFVMFFYFIRNMIFIGNIKKKTSNRFFLLMLLLLYVIIYWSIYGAKQA